MKSHSIPPRWAAEFLEARIAPAAANLNLGSLVASKGFEIPGVASYDQSGVAVFGGVDINGDGIGDFLIGADGADTNGDSSGTVYVVFGREGGFGSGLDLGSLDGNLGFVIHGEAEGNQFGYSLSSGDINGDGFGDIILGAPGANVNGSGSGAAYVVFGRSGAFTPVLDLTSLDGTNGFKLTGGAEGDQAGGAVSGAGDFNGDGFDDIVIGATGVDTPGGVNSGAAYVVFGRDDSFSPVVNLAILEGTAGFRISGASVAAGAGTSVSGAGDVNGDGFDDVIIGSPGATGNGLATGAAYVVLGREAGVYTDLSVAVLDGSTGFALYGEAEDDAFGVSVSGAGDVNGDGFSDLVIGAPYHSDLRDYAGASYVVFGKSGAFAATLQVSTLAGSNGFKIIGERTEDYSGVKVSDAGDVNGDGFDDIIIGAYGVDATGESAGASYVVFGKGSAFAATFRLSALNGNNGFQINGAHEYDYSGSAVSGAGDINGDGIDDLIIGAPSASPNGVTYAGSSFVVYGKASDAPPPPPPNVSTVVVTEADGDVVTITLNGGQLLPIHIKIGPDGSIEMIDLTHLATGAVNAIGAKPMNLAISVKAAASGVSDGKTKIGLLNATGLGLGKVSIDGSLGQIFAGNGTTKSAVQSLILAGNFGTLIDSPVISKMIGGMDQFVVNGSFAKGTMEIQGSVRFVSIGEDFIGNFTGLFQPELAVTPGAADPFPGVVPLTAGSFLADAIGKMKIGGSMKGGVISTTKDLGPMKMLDFQSGGLFSGGKMKSVKVRGNMWTDSPDAPLIMTAREGIDKLVVNGDVANARIFAGYTKDGDPVNPDARIGRVIVKGDWKASSLVAGVDDITGDGFGQNDLVIAGESTPAVSRIASVVIKGTAIGSEASGDHYGITAEKIGKISIGGASVSLTSAADNIVLDTVYNDFRVVEIG